MGDKVVGTFRAKHQPTQTGAARAQDAVNDICRHAFTLWGEQFNEGVIQFEQRVAGTVVGVRAVPAGRAAQEGTVLSARPSEVSDCDDDVVDGSLHRLLCRHSAVLESSPLLISNRYPNRFAGWRSGATSLLSDLHYRADKPAR